MKKEIKQYTLQIPGLHKELDRARELLKAYEEIPTGFFGVAIIKQAIQKAEKAIEEGDVVKELVAYKELKSLK